MSVGYSQFWRQAFNDYVFRGAALPSIPTSLQIALHTGQPAAGRSNEASGGSYAPITIPIANRTANFAAATAANPSVSANSAVLTFPTATSTGYNSGSTPMTFWAVWNGAGTTAADLICYGSIPSQLVPGGVTPTFAISQFYTQLAET